MSHDLSENDCPGYLRVGKLGGQSGSATILVEYIPSGVTWEGKHER